MVWFSALKLGLNAATHIYKKKQETKMAMADAQHMHAAKMARGESEYQGKLLEARQSVDIKPLTADIAINKAEIAVLNAKVNEMKARSDNPLSQ
jgi:hypothetical protein